MHAFQIQYFLPTAWKWHLLGCAKPWLWFVSAWVQVSSSSQGECEGSCLVFVTLWRIYITMHQLCMGPGSGFKQTSAKYNRNDYYQAVMSAALCQQPIIIKAKKCNFNGFEECFKHSDNLNLRDSQSIQKVFRPFLHIFSSLEMKA